MNIEYKAAISIPRPSQEVSHDELQSVAPPTQVAPSHAALGDDALVQACLGGDQHAWNKLVERYTGLVYSVARRTGLSPTDADDVFQDVFTIVFQSLASLRDQTRLVFWLITITRRESLRVLSQGSLQTNFDDSLDEIVADVDTPAGATVERWESHQLVNQALERLDARSRELVQALFFDSSPPRYDELAERLGIPRGSIGPTRARLMKKIETILLGMGTEMPF